MRERLLPRPLASTGGWLSLLLPAALITGYVHGQGQSPAAAAVHRLLIAAAIGMCLRTLCFLLAHCIKGGRFLDFTAHLFPALGCCLCLQQLLPLKWPLALGVGLLITFLYQRFYIAVMRGLPGTFSFGEAAILTQGIALFVVNGICRIFWPISSKDSEFDQLNVIMLSALMCLLLVCLALALLPWLRKPLFFYPLMFLLLLAVTCAPVTQPLPVLALLQFLQRSPKRLLLIFCDFLLVGATCGTVSWQLRNSVQANTRVRKVFHVLIVLVFVPGLVYECALLYLATGVALAIFTLLELLRLLQMPPFAATLNQAFQSFKDEKDAGKLALTPFCLLIGCALPIWLTPRPCGASSQLLPLLAGILAVGVGDTAASVLGSKYGRNKWSNSSRSLEGTFAFVVSVLLSVWLLQLSGVLAMSQAMWFATVFAALNSALVEAFTDQVDNLVLPLVFYVIVGLA